MEKKKNHSAPAAAGSSGTKAIDKLKDLNDQLVKEVAKCRKQIEQLQFQLATLAPHHNILAGSEHNVSSIAERQRDASSSLTEDASAHDTTEMAVKEAESAAAQLDAAEMRPLAVVREKDEIQSNMGGIIADKDCSIRCLEPSLEQSRKKSVAGGRKWNGWICSVVVATASFCVAAAVVTLCCHKSSNPKN